MLESSFRSSSAAQDVHSEGTGKRERGKGLTSVTAAATDTPILIRPVWDWSPPTSVGESDLGEPVAIRRRPVRVGGRGRKEAGRAERMDERAKREDMICCRGQEKDG